MEINVCMGCQGHHMSTSILITDTWGVVHLCSLCMEEFLDTGTIETWGEDGDA